MRKVLIYLKEKDLAPVGGAKGYNYNLMLGLKEIANMEIQVSFLPGVSSATKINNRVNAINNGGLRNFIKVIKSMYKKGIMMYGVIHRAAIDLNGFDVVHFHSTTDLYNVKDSLANYNGKIVLTSHTPTMPCKETSNLLTEFEKKHMAWFYKKLPEIDRFAFDRADYIIYPCVEAEEPYYHEWPGYETIHEKNKKKFLYMPTGTRPQTAQLSRDEVRTKYKIPSDAFVVTYIGRHNKIKGYERLKLIGNQILDDAQNIYFLIGGKEEPLKGLSNPKWIEAGWTNDPGSLISAADLFLLPNEETYFDLVMLEVLSLGQIILASRTGGNKYFQQFRNSGIFLYDKVDEAINLIYHIKSLSEREQQIMKEANRKIYINHFTNELFAKNYCDIMLDILK